MNTNLENIADEEILIKTEKKEKKLLYNGTEETELNQYLDTNPRYHNWSMSCDVGH